MWNPFWPPVCPGDSFLSKPCPRIRFCSPAMAHNYFLDPSCQRASNHKTFSDSQCSHSHLFFSRLFLTLFANSFSQLRLNTAPQYDPAEFFSTWPILRLKLLPAVSVLFDMCLLIVNRPSELSRSKAFPSRGMSSVWRWLYQSLAPLPANLSDRIGPDRLPTVVNSADPNLACLPSPVGPSFRPHPGPRPFAWSFDQFLLPCGPIDSTSKWAWRSLALGSSGRGSVTSLPQARLNAQVEQVVGFVSKVPLYCTYRPQHTLDVNS